MSVCSIAFFPALSRPNPAPRRAHPTSQAALASQPARISHGCLHPSPHVATPLLAALRGPLPCRARPQGGDKHESFSHDLFMETIDYHKRINVHPAIEALRGDKVVSARIYWRMLVDKLVFHTALEKLLAKHHDEPLLEPFRAPVLARSQRLRNDLRALAQKPHVHMPKPAPASCAAHDYIEALDLAARRDPRALAAHAWLHYLGDMHGGQLMQGRLAERHGEDTVSCFAFAEAVDALRKTYGRALDVPLTPYEQRLLREEAVSVHEHSLRMHDRWMNP